MKSSFFGINVASQGLFTAQTALDVTNNNISNIETPGYSRQQVIQRASRPLPYANRGMIGTGAEIIDVKQQRSTYIDKKYWSMSTDYGQYEVKKSVLSQLEIIFNEPSDTGYNMQMNQLFSTLQTLSTNPAEDAMVSNFIDSGTSFAQYFNHLAKQLADQQRDANFGVKTSVEEINFISGQLSAINHQIANMELGGITANNLRDERANLIDRLSQIVNIDAKELTDVNGKKKFNVTINGQTLVDGSTSNFLEIRSRDKLSNPEDELDLYDIYWTSGKKLYLNNESASGELKGYLDVRDGNNSEVFKGDIVLPITAPNTTIEVANINTNDIPASGYIWMDNQAIEYTSYTYLGPNIRFNLATPAPATATTVRVGEEVNYKGVPYYTKRLNEFVRTLARNFNAVHKTGNNGTGTELFSFKGYTGTPALDESNPYTYNQITIDNFSFSQEIIDNHSLLLNTANSGQGESANDIYLKLLNLRQDDEMFSKGKPDHFMQALVTELGIDVKQSNSFSSGQSNLIKLVDQQRKAISSVDINEETTDMLRFQQAYNLSAKMISVMDEIYDVMINQLVRG